MRIAILGATGLVGRTMLELIADRSWITGTPSLLSSSRSAGVALRFRGESLACADAAAMKWAGIDLVLASAGAAASRRYAPLAAAAGAWVVDNSAAFRAEPRVPLVVPEINGRLLDDCRDQALAGRGGIVANPNCSTIQIAVAVAPLHGAFAVREVHVTTLQSVSGAGQRGLDELSDQQREDAAAAVGSSAADVSGAVDSSSTGEGSPAARGSTAMTCSPAESARPGPVTPRRIAGNAVPAIGTADAEGWYTEETKVRHELRKILDLPALAVTCTATRVPVRFGHAAACRVICGREVARESAVAALQAAPGVAVASDPADYLSPAEIAGQTLVHVGRLRRDPDRRDTLLFWVVADNLLKGAAWNAVQIADRLAEGRP